MPVEFMYPVTLFCLSGDATLFLEASYSFSADNGSTGFDPTSSLIFALDTGGFTGYRYGYTLKFYCLIELD
jgi:hypothetical protein